MLARSFVGQFITDDSASMGYERSNHILFEAKSEIKVRPRFVAILKHRHAEDKVVDIFDIAFAFSLVAKAEHHTWDLDVGQGHVV